MCTWLFSIWLSLSQSECPSWVMVMSSRVETDAQILHIENGWIMWCHAHTLPRMRSLAQQSPSYTMTPATHTVLAPTILPVGIYLVKLQTFTWVTTARTIRLPEQKETIHMISMLRKEAFSGSMQDLAHIPTQNCVADFLTNVSAKADNLITALKTGNCWMLKSITLMEHSWNTTPSCLHGAGHLCKQRRRMFSS